ncbi:methylaspartate ammonia-lyase [Haloferax gibbonsii]|uniref:methylaspartate ammonia-lyase n=1 Tax=Haloferax gibbonsii TaxID=35746 RepID=A0A0K1IYI9_HALGI|nr:methylaspartate ammonia-lyase [Haloferax gibbonsii]AKU09375.1 methylaspartate ammonia-lyase [Haloferax gibbonsii]
MPTIADVSAIPTAGGFYFDDKEAITRNATTDGFSYTGQPVTDGFSRVRQPAEALSIVVELDNGRYGTGDCAAVQYSGFGGRDPFFDAQAHADLVESTLADAFVGRDAGDFTGNVAAIQDSIESGDPLHTAVRYGFSQALLDAAAEAHSTTMTEVIIDEYGLSHTPEPVPIFTQTGDSRRQNAEKMILKGVPVLPHGLFNSVEKTGRDGERLLEYLSWLSDRVAELGAPGYEPVFHVDVYGTIGEIFGPPYGRTEVVEYFAALQEAAAPYTLQVESPIEADSRDEQITVLGALRDGLADAAVPVSIVADEWCNTYDDITAFVDAGAVDVVQIKTPDLGELTESIAAVQYCEGTGTGAYLGGSCAETDVSARVCTHVALATQPIQLLARPGMGVDEAYMIVQNEMTRTLNRIVTQDQQAALQ